MKEGEERKRREKSGLPEKKKEVCIDIIREMIW
jgi:hypothetical protein